MMKSDDQFVEKVVEEVEKFQGNIIRVTEQVVELPDGRTSKREVVYHSGAIAILALTDQNEMIVERQWRAPIRAVSYEVPAGKVDERDTEIIDTVNRELNEETRLQAGKVEAVAGFYTSIGFSDEFMTLYVATELTPVANALPQDDDEMIELVYWNFDKATEMFNSGEMNDAKTVMAYLYWKTLQK
ncbi:NUDIX hydrolase [Weissella muntiaci]|nr:NUDIX hydrolase [Weissella muntiaci]